MNKETVIKTNCKFYKGNVPCQPHKQYGYSCIGCNLFEPLGKRILIIKLGAAGDVIRTTPLLRKIRQVIPTAEIIWLTYFPELLPPKWINKIVNFEPKNILWLTNQKFDWLINLDKDDEAIALASEIKAERKSGFIMDRRGKCKPVSNDAETHKWLTGLRDDLNKSNTKSYMAEIFEICGYKFNREKYIFENTVNKKLDNINRTEKVIGINTGCGTRWNTRLWSDNNWVDLAQRLKKLNYEVIILGGPQEHQRNDVISRESKAKYFGYFDLPNFINLVDNCDFIISQVTMAMHIAIGLNKTLILINNIFNKNEFYLYDNGFIMEPGIDCLGCFKQGFDKHCPVSNCMDLIKPEDIIEKLITL